MQSEHIQNKKNHSTYFDLLFWILLLILDTFLVWNDSLIALIGIILWLLFYLKMRESIIANNKSLGKELSLGLRRAIGGSLLAIITFALLIYLFTFEVPSDPLEILLFVLFVCLIPILGIRLVTMSAKQ
jgi:hypothetical protein